MREFKGVAGSRMAFASAYVIGQPKQPPAAGKSLSSGFPADRLRKGMAVAMIAGVAGFGLAGCGSTPKNDTFDLAAASVPADGGRSAKGRQILIPDPTALKALDSEQIVVRVSGSELQYLAKAQWSDRLPRMVQSKLIEAFENSGRLGGVGKPGQGLAIDYQLVTDIRAFEVEASGNRAVVEISAKLLNDRNGAIKAQKVFRSVVATRGSANPAFIAGLDTAFAAVTGEIVTWTLSQL